MADPVHFEQRRSRSWVLAVGTLACPRCDAPVAPGPGALKPAQPLRCPYCAQTGAVRDFLSLGAPSRPARVEVRVLPPRAVPGRDADPAAGAG